VNPPLPPPPPNLELWWAQTRAQALAHGISPGEVDFLVREVTGLDRIMLLQGRTVALEPFARLQRLWQQRLRLGTPVQYLVGEVLWRDLRLKVAAGVLIPRPETELLVDWVVEALAEKIVHTLVDVGTGSGCLALGLARALPHVEVFALDLSPVALEIAQQNVEKLQLAHRVHLLQSNWSGSLTQIVDVLVSNPPYIPSHLLDSLDAVVRNHEPHFALDGGVDGLDAFRILVAEGARILSPGGLWAVEVMQDQADAVMQLLLESTH